MNDNLQSQLEESGQHSVNSRSAENSSSNHPAVLGFVCPVCGGTLEDIKLKRICNRCRTIVETCCEGGRG